MFPLADARGPRPRLRRAPDARRPAAQVPEHARTARCSPRARSSTGSTMPGGRSPQPARRSWSRATPTCSMLHQAGVERVVASMGTALTERQVARAAAGLLGTVRLAFDADAAGQEASLRGMELAQRARAAGAGGLAARRPGPGRRAPPSAGGLRAALEPPSGALPDLPGRAGRWSRASARRALPACAGAAAPRRRQSVERDERGADGVRPARI